MTTRIGDATRARIAGAWPDLIAAVTSGNNIGKACELAGVTRDQVREYRLENRIARDEWEMAREQSADAYADQIADIANSPGPDGQIARVRMDALRWLASKRNPRVYSDKATLDVNVRTVDLTRIIADANARLAAAGQVGRIIDAEIARAALPAPAGLAELL